MIQYSEQELLQIDIRIRRNILLEQVDKYQKILVYSSLTEAQKEELKKYRQELLDSPQTLQLPKMPDWM